MAALLDNEFEIGQTVYLRTDKDQAPRIITAIIIKPGALLYELGSGAVSTWHYGFEVSVDVDVLKTTNN